MNVSSTDGKTFINGKEYVVPPGASLSMKRGVLHINGEPQGEALSAPPIIQITGCSIKKIQLDDSDRVEVTDCVVERLQVGKGDVAIEGHNTVKDVEIVDGNLTCDTIDGNVSVAQGSVSVKDIGGDCVVSRGDVTATEIKGGCRVGIGKLKRTEREEVLPRDVRCRTTSNDVKIYTKAKKLPP